ncbi:MAG: SprT family zinc-dependent metalloprotease [Dehalococcoidia bacterium]|nr:SprT family zinc-dependent metalloprotease [Dehalococcoidia bacterium]
MRQIEIEGVGPVLLQRSERARRLIISVRPSKGVRVAVPRGVSFREAENFVHVKTDWIRKHVQKAKQSECEHESMPLIPIDESAARRKLIGRLQDLAKKHGFTYNKVSIRNQRTRWGSCSTKNNISLNMKLAALPDDLMDYVILHELVHTRVKNHSKAFWEELDRHVGNAKQKSASLRGYRLSLP